jgi:hypothetical protein
MHVLKKDAGAKLAPFDWGGVSARIALRNRWCPTTKIFFVNIFPKKVARGGRGGKSKIFYPDIQKRGQKHFSGQKPVKLKVKIFFSDIHQFNYRSKKFFRTNSCWNPYFWNNIRNLKSFIALPIQMNCHTPHTSPLSFVPGFARPFLSFCPTRVPFRKIGEVRHPPKPPL